MSIDAEAPAFPAFLKLGGKRVVVIGGGMMAGEKIPALIEAQAEITVIAPEISEEVRALPGLTLEERPYASGDLAGAWYVVAAAPPEVNRAVSEEAAERQTFVNAVDDRRYADVYLGSILRRGGMTFVISSDGAAPALTALLRRGLEELIPEELSAWKSLAETKRAEWKAKGIPFLERRPLLLQAMNAWYERTKD